ncbi:hypothetical protein B0H99_101390 [Planomicrobium soli]|uniref:Uncharacterized protein n=1 Tax=Planomicrobium soli TaxID=1176648 RepID=A0A2P8H7E9_9BACL|nr:hypothetical protein [Planomicrobium soli]PSL42142.1 hypothetical protein B0H99_101390 [Planomicrobium soli]
MIQDILALDSKILLGIITALVASITTLFIFTLSNLLQRKQKLFEGRPDIVVFSRKTSFDKRQTKRSGINNLIRVTRDFRTIKSNKILIKNKEESFEVEKNDVKARILYFHNLSECPAINIKIIIDYTIEEDVNYKKKDRKYSLNRLNKKDMLLIPVDVTHEGREVFVEKISYSYKTIYRENIKVILWSISDEPNFLMKCLLKFNKDLASVSIQFKRILFVYVPFEFNVTDDSFYTTYVYEDLIKTNDKIAK